MGDLTLGTTTTDVIDAGSGCTSDFRIDRVAEG